MSAAATGLQADQKLAAIYGEEFPLLRLIRDAGRRLREIREEQGLTQYELADLMSTHQCQVSNTELGKALTMTVRSLANQSAALGYRMVITFEPEGSDG